MLYLTPTKNGIGIQIWGTYDDLNIFYDFLSKFWSDDKKQNIKGFDNRDKLISSFSYQIRKAKDGHRLKRKCGHFSFEEQNYYGAKISWVHILFTLTAIKYNMRFSETTKYDVSQLLNLEFWIENAMKNYDEIGARNLIGFIEDGLYGANEYIYQYMRSINYDFLILGGGKKSFRKLPELLRRGIFFTEEYKEYALFLESEAKKFNCSISELDLDDKDFDYDKIKW